VDDVRGGDVERARARDGWVWVWLDQRLGKGETGAVLEVSVEGVVPARCVCFCWWVVGLVG
jgi:hypothetical protein